LYYTAFGLRTLELFGPTLWCSECRCAARQWARSEVGKNGAGLTDLNAWVAAERILGAPDPDGIIEIDAPLRQRIRDRIAGFRTPEGTASRIPDTPPGPYGTFLVLTVAQALDERWLEPDGVTALLRERFRGDGGFAESATAESSGANPTTAAIVLLHEFHVLDTFPKDRIHAFLTRMQRADGGFAAHREAAGSELLSTFTALLGLYLIGNVSKIHAGQAARFVRACLQADGTFAASPLDETGDTEYTYYGTGALALLAEFATARRAAGSES